MSGFSKNFSKKSYPGVNPPLPITVIMLTLNEEINLPRAIENVKYWAQEIFVVDSCSTDSTVDIALGHGVGVVQRAFTNFGDQWNFALDNLPIKTPWTLKLDPDEFLTDKLKESIANAVISGTRFSGFEITRRLWFMGKPLHVKQSVLRLWGTGLCRFSDVIVNEHPIVNGEIGRLDGLMEHFDSPDLHHWWEKQNKYTTMRAIEIVKGEKLSAEPDLFGNPLERRMFFICVFFRIPFRYKFQWLYEMFVRGAWRDRFTGLAWVKLRINVRRMCELKIKEITITGRVPELPKAPAGKFDLRVLDSPLQKKFTNN